MQKSYRCAFMALALLATATATVSGLKPVILTTATMQAHILPIGATVQRLIVPDKDGVAEDVVLGYDDPKQYQVRFWHAASASSPHQIRAHTIIYLGA